MQLDDLSLLLFLPANRLDRLEKAVSTTADAVVLDLEDAVAVDQKKQARDGLIGALNAAAALKPIVLRINGADTNWHADDVAVATGLPVAAVMLPKAESAATCADVRQACGKPIIALIETAKGVLNANEIANASNRLAFGNLDFAADIGIGQDRLALAHARSVLVLASRGAGTASPIDGVTQEFNDLQVVEDDARHSRSMGFAGKLLIHPKQIEPTRLAFRPGPEEIAWAEKILTAAGSETGVLTMDGSMIDAPVLKRAREIMRRS
ncbi:MAG: CoA ester lyase [Mesorhizobium sp.]|nr:CoA ester lyase [Mesorhizobium sp.]MBL8580314.1 CoA ester lyase [Mesorhizobium sp.]